MADIIIPYRPRSLQYEYHKSNKRWRLVLAHRRFGKTVMAVNDLIRKAVTCPLENPRVYYISPYLVQTKQIAWDYAKKYSAPIPGVKVNESELRIDFPNGGRLQLLGADNIQRLRGIYVDHIVFDEYDQISPSLWSEVIRPALSDRKGGATFMGTPQGHGNLYELMNRVDDDWDTFLFKASETGYVSREELELAEKSMTPDLYAQEFELSFEAAIKGAYYADELSEAKNNHRICNIPYEPTLPVNTYWDIGWRDDTSIVFAQVFGKEIRIIDSYSNSGMTLPEYISVLRDKGYKYGDHYFPWDAFITKMSDGKSTADVARECGLSVKRSPDVSIQDGIQQGRMLFNRMWFNEPNTKDLIKSLSMYRREWNDKTQTFRNNPLHDWTSHYADAFRYMSISIKKDQPRDNYEVDAQAFIDGRKRNDLPGIQIADYNEYQRSAQDFITFE